MEFELEEQNLIFLISQPRSGSSLLQRMLASHSEICSPSEPWLMLHPIYALRPDGINAEFNSKFAYRALNNFLDLFPEGRTKYFQSIKLQALYLYSGAVQSPREKLFLDKTPRYFLIINELAEIFPNAKFIFLLRNPLAVLVSIFETWIRDDLLKLFEFRKDLLEAPKLMVSGIGHLQKKARVIKFEELLSDPKSRLESLCSWLDIPYSPTLIDYGEHEMPQWKYGDQRSLYRFKKPQPELADAWKNALGNPQLWRLATDYLEMLDSEVFNGLGYDVSDLSEFLLSKTPNPASRSATVSLRSLLKKKKEDRSFLYRKFTYLIGTIHFRGVFPSVQQIKSILLNGRIAST